MRTTFFVGRLQGLWGLSFVLSAKCARLSLGRHSIAVVGFGFFLSTKCARLSFVVRFKFHSQRKGLFCHAFYRGCGIFGFLKIWMQPVAVFAFCFVKFPFISPVRGVGQDNTFEPHAVYGCVAGIEGEILAPGA